MLKRSLILGSGLLGALAPVAVSARVQVVASTADLAYLAHEIGGDLVKVEAIASPKTDVHYVEVRPSYMVKVKKADVVLKVGLELDLWMDQIIDGSRNADVEIVDCSRYVEPLEVPAFEADARHGDLHRFGNPHYWLAPDNLEPITRAIAEGLASADPEHAAAFVEARDAFLTRIRMALPDLMEFARPLDGVEIVFYHNSWPYFNAFAGLVAAGFIEPFPGVPPSPSHVAAITDLIRKRRIAVIAVEPYFDRRIPDKVAADTGAKVVTLYPSIGGRGDGETYLQWIEGNLAALKEALP